MTDLLSPPTLTREQSWTASSVSPNSILHAFSHMWMEIAEERRSGDRLARQLADAGMVRTQTINLIAITESDRETESVQQVLHELHEFIPSRVIILQRVEGGEEDLEVTVKVEERPRTPPMAPTRLEVVRVKARREQLASVALPIFVPELPDFVWCANGEFFANPLVTDMTRFADRLVVDSALSSAPGAALRFLNGISQDPRMGIRISDLAWSRLHPWRQMIAQFFDVTEAAPCLGAIEEVVVEYAAGDETGHSGITAALLIAGWLATRLGWRAPGEELVRSRDGWKLTLRAGERGRSREVVLIMRPVQNPMAAPSLSAVTMSSSGDSIGAFAVRRASPEMMETTSELFELEPSARMVYAPNRDDQRLLTNELRSFGADVIHQEALAFAANLWPDEAPAR